MLYILYIKSHLCTTVVPGFALQFTFNATRWQCGAVFFPPSFSFSLKAKCLGCFLLNKNVSPFNVSFPLRLCGSLMAQYVPGERVCPQDLLNFITKHRLFPHAEASLRLHIPHIQRDFSLGLQVRPSLALPPSSRNSPPPLPLLSLTLLPQPCRAPTRTPPW